MANWLQKQWHSYTWWHLFLLPVSWLFFSLVFIRKLLYRVGWFKSTRLSVPVIVVGNINVGGTGKTPLVIWLVEQLQQAGFKPGVISRGYGGKATQSPMPVYANSDARQVGDEPVLIAMRTQCPVFIHRNRVSAGKALLSAHPECSIIISDDGLQHYRLQRDIEIVVIDGSQGLGNGALLPAGPLRELKSRLNNVDALVVNGQLQKDLNVTTPVIDMHLQADAFYNLKELHRTCESQDFANQSVLAVAGIGNPGRFFQQLTNMGIQFSPKSYPDHYIYNETDFVSPNDRLVLMTEKDAVKCRTFAQSNFWVLPVKAVIKSDLMTIILNKLRP